MACRSRLTKKEGASVSGLLEELKRQKEQVIERVHAGEADPAEVRGLTEDGVEDLPRISIDFDKFRSISVDFSGFRGFFLYLTRFRGGFGLVSPGLDCHRVWTATVRVWKEIERLEKVATKKSDQELVSLANSLPEGRVKGGMD